VLPALWDLVWAGEVRNDAWTPLRAGKRYAAPRPQRMPARRFSRQRANTNTATQGRWSLTDNLFAETPDRRALAELLLERQGIVTRDGVRAEGIQGGYGAVYGELRALETLGVCRRGYFVEGLGGAQFALAGGVERLREMRPREDDEPEALVLAAADPAQPYGAALAWPKRANGRAARVAGAHVVLLGGEPALYVERGGKSLVPLRDPEDEWMRVALAALVEHVKRRGRKRLAGRAVRRRAGRETDAMPLLLEAGFLAGRAAQFCVREVARGGRGGRAARGCGADPPRRSARSAPWRARRTPTRRTARRARGSCSGRPARERLHLRGQARERPLRRVSRRAAGCELSRARARATTAAARSPRLRRIANRGCERRLTRRF
jgi:hypothetical protein